MKHIFLTLAFIAWGVSAQAQTDLKKEVNVTRAYEPSVSDFFKQGMTPDMTDTTQLRPDFNYTIKPQPIATAFSIDPIKAVTINTIHSGETYPGFVKVGLGMPIRSLLEAGYVADLQSGSRVGVILSHYGEYSKVKNDQGIKAPISNTRNNLLLFGEKLLWRRYILGGDFNYNYRTVTNYGYYNYGDPMPEGADLSRKGLSQYFNRLDGKINFGDSFSDFSRVNFRVNADMTYFADKFKNDIFRINAIAEVGFGVAPGANVRAKFNYISNWGFNNLNEYHSQVFAPGVSFNFKNSVAKFSIGLDNYYDPGGKLNRLYPILNAEVPLFNGAMTPYLNTTGRMFSNNFINLTAINPHLIPGTQLPLSDERLYRIGVKGLLFSRLSYNVYGGYDKVNRNAMFYNAYNENSYGNLMEAVYDTLSAWRFGTELDLQITKSFNVYGSVLLSSHDLKYYEALSGVPDAEFGAGIKYNWRNRLHLDLGLTVLGERLFLQQDRSLLDVRAKHSYVKAPVMCDLTFNAEYAIDQRFGVFLNLNNILNQKLYIFNRYPLPGISAMVGVRFSF